MSLLDALKDPTMQRGLLELGLRLMSTPGKFGQALGQSGLGAMQGVAQYKQQQFQEELRKHQLAQMERDKQQQAKYDKLEALPGQFIRPETQGNNPSAYMPPSYDLEGLAKAYMSAPGGFQTGLALQSSLQKDDTPIKASPGDVFFNRAGRQLFAAPAKPEQDPEQIRTLKAIYGDGTPEYQQALKLLGNKVTSHQPGVNVSYGAPIPAVNPKTGETELYRPDNRGGMTTTGIKPPPQNRDVKMPAELQRMQIAGDAMGELLNDYEAMLKKHNPRDPAVQANPSVRAEMQSLKRNLELQFKELQALGALAGPDIEIMRQALSDPFTFQGAYYGRDGLLGQVQQARRLLRVRRDAVAASQGKSDKPDNDPLGLR